MSDQPALYEIVSVVVNCATGCRTTNRAMLSISPDVITLTIRVPHEPAPRVINYPPEACQLVQDVMSLTVDATPRRG